MKYHHRILTGLISTIFICGSAIGAQTSASYVIGPDALLGGAINSLQPVTQSVLLNTPSNTSSAQLSNLTTFGTIKSTATVSTTGAGTTQIQNNSIVSDSITFENAALIGSTGYVTARIYYDWDLSSAAIGSSGSANATAALNLTLGNNSVSAFERRSVGCSFSGTCQVNTVPLLVTGAVVASSPYNFIDGRFAFTFGQQNLFSVSFTENVSSRSSLGGQASADIDAAHSIYWGGILSVTDSNGSSISYLASSESGFDYSKSFAPVPEMGSLAMMSIGLAFLVLFRKPS